MKKAIVSFANKRGNYVKGLSRLSESLRDNFDGDFLGFITEASIGAPAHVINPYAFKIYGIQKAIDEGYDQILWLDASAFAIKNVQPIFDEIQENGFIFQEAGHMAGTWTNDFTLKHFGITRDEAMEMKMVGNAGFLGLDFSHVDAVDFFTRWRESMKAGCFKGLWNNDHKSESEDERCRGHRHDMSCSSIILNQMGLIDLAKKGDEWLQYAGVFEATLNDTIIIKAQGC